MGGDSLLPIVGYVIIKANVRNLVSELDFLEDFLDFTDPKAVSDEIGYTLATFQTGLLFLQAMNKTELQAAAIKNYVPLSSTAPALS